MSGRSPRSSKTKNGPGQNRSQGLNEKILELVKINLSDYMKKAEFDAFKQDLEVAKNTIQVVSYKMDLQEKMMTNDRIEEKIKAIEDENDPS